MTTAFVFSGGGNLGALQVGMLRGLLEADIHPDMLIGSSVGALNAAYFGADPTPARVERLASVWEGIHRRDFFGVSPGGSFRGVLQRNLQLFDGSRLHHFIDDVVLGFRRLEDAALPVHIVATDRSTRRPVVMSEGDAGLALLASAAIPGIFPAVRVGQNMLIDGAVSANVPIAQARALGADVIYVLPTGSGRGRPPGSGAVHVLPAPSMGALSMFDFRTTPVMIQRAYAATCTWLSDRLARSTADSAGAPG